MNEILMDLAELGKLMENDPAMAADRLEMMASTLMTVAREARKRGNVMRSPAGLRDRVQMEVYGPDGKLKHRTDTGSN